VRKKIKKRKNERKEGSKSTSLSNNITLTNQTTSRCQIDIRNDTGKKLF
jgi:hypothetical protein